MRLICAPTVTQIAVCTVQLAGCPAANSAFAQGAFRRRQFVRGTPRVQKRGYRIYHIFNRQERRSFTPRCAGYCGPQHPLHHVTSAPLRLPHWLLLLAGVRAASAVLNHHRALALGRLVTSSGDIAVHLLLHRHKQADGRRSKDVPHSRCRSDAHNGISIRVIDAQHCTECLHPPSRPPYAAGLQQTPPKGCTLCAAIHCHYYRIQLN